MCMFPKIRSLVSIRYRIVINVKGYGFVEFRSEEDADYAIKIMHMIKLYGKPIKVNKASQDKRT